MKPAKPTLEKINPGFGSSFHIKHYQDPCRDKKPFWHFHPEVELVYIEGGSGKRHIGNHMSYFHGGDLLFIGSNLPHYGFTDRLTGNKSENIIQLRKDFLGQSFLHLPEMATINRLFERGKSGLAFHEDTKLKVGAQILEMSEMNRFEKLIQLLKILNTLGSAEDYTVLNAQDMVVEVQAEDTNRMRMIYSYVRDHFKEPISLDQISDVASMTVPAFCRYFKKMTRKTFTQFVNEYRMVHASKLLAETSMSISEACYESGFNNFSHFNKNFKNYTGKSPSQFRKEITLTV